MNLSEKSFKLFLLIFAVAVTFVMVSSFVLRVYNERNFPEKFGRREETKDENELLPQIINKPNEKIVVGEEFVFIPRVAPSDTDFNLNLLQSPDWMVFQEGVIRGIPTEIGVFDYTVRLGSNAVYYDEKFYLVVEENSNE